MEEILKLAVELAQKAEQYNSEVQVNMNKKEFIITIKLDLDGNKEKR